MAAADPFAAVEKLDDALIQMMAARFEARGRHPFFSRGLPQADSKGGHDDRR